MRWVAVRHASDHIHLVATLVRQDRIRPKVWNGEPGHVEVAVTAIDVRQQIQVTAGGRLAAGHRAEDPGVAHTKALAKLCDRITVRTHLVQRNGTPRNLNPHVPTSVTGQDRG